jgi:hypothetical protein
MADASHGPPFPAVLARGMKATRPPESNPHHPPLLQTLGRCPFKAAPAASPCTCAAAHGGFPQVRRRPCPVAVGLLFLLRRKFREGGEGGWSGGGGPKGAGAMPLPESLFRKEKKERRSRGRRRSRSRNAAGPPRRRPACTEAA